MTWAWIFFRRRRQRNLDSSMGSPMVTPTQSRTTFSGSPIMGGDTPSVSDTRGFIDDAINTSSSAGSSLDPVLPIDGHGTIVTSYDDYMSLPENARSTIFSSLAGSGSGAGSAAGPSPPPPPIPVEVVPRTRDLQEHGNFLFARQPPNFHNPIWLYSATRTKSISSPQKIRGRKISSLFVIQTW